MKSEEAESDGNVPVRIRKDLGVTVNTVSLGRYYNSSRNMVPSQVGTSGRNISRETTGCGTIAAQSFVNNAVEVRKLTDIGVGQRIRQRLELMYESLLNLLVLANCPHQVRERHSCGVCSGRDVGLNFYGEVHG